MQNKRLLLLIGALGVLTLIGTSLIGSSFFSGMNRYMPGMMRGNDASTSKMMVEDTPAGYGGGLGAPAMQRIEPDIYYPPYYGDDALGVDERVYLHSSSHDVVVSNVADYLGQLRDYITSVDGRVLSYSVNNYDDMQSGYIRARVPDSSFEEARSRVSNNVEEVVRENVDSQDVTGQVVGREERVAQLQGQLDELNARLAGLEEGTSAYVQVQSQIDRVEAQLEQAQNAQEQMEENVQYSTIYVTAADSKRYFDRGSRPDPLTEIENAIESLGDTLVGLGYLLIWVVVYAVIWLPIVLVARWVWRKFKK